jgi:hypothetical protein
VLSATGYPTGDVQAWVRYNGQNGSILAGMSVSSVTVFGGSTADTQVNYSRPMVPNYCVSGMGQQFASGGQQAANNVFFKIADMPQDVTYTRFSNLGGNVNTGVLAYQNHVVVYS